MQQSPSSVCSSCLPTQIHQGISEDTAHSHSRDKCLVSSSCPSLRLSLSVGMFQRGSHWTYLVKIIYWTFIKICRGIPSLVKIGRFTRGPKYVLVFLATLNRH